MSAEAGEPFRVIVAAHDDSGQEIYVYGWATELLNGWAYGRWTTTVEWVSRPQRAGEWPGEFAGAQLTEAASGEALPATGS